MSSTPVTRAAAVTPDGPHGPHGLDGRRVRHQARDAAVLMSFSLAMSVLFAGAFLLLAGLGR